MILELQSPVVLAIAAILIAMNRRRYSARLARCWNLEPATVRVVASDPGRHRSSRPMVVDGLSGAPDAIFLIRRTGGIIIGEATSRHSRGSIISYEHHQVMLHLGMALRLSRRPAECQDMPVSRSTGSETQSSPCGRRWRPAARPPWE
ncbi:MAG: hypothetical protein J4G15_16500 [Alphaproteobacteria bacterium]|nr:hypothetical protein [Alphaproteobacteria bacterium]